MKKYRITAVTLILLTCYVLGFTQKLPYYYPKQDIKVFDDKGVEYKSPFCGGLMFPIFSNMDLNGDSIQDLVIIDRADDKLLTFLNETTDPDSPKYIYAPRFERFFPSNLMRWVYLVDYDNDQKKDIFAYASYAGAGIEVYRNVSDSMGLKFEQVVSPFITASYYGNPYEFNIYLSRLDIPSIVDLDGDKDLDIILFDILGGYLNWFENISMDLYGHCDSLKYVYSDQCWGKIMENDSSFLVSCNITCSPVRKCLWDTLGIREKQKMYHRGETRSDTRHTGSTLLVHDLDGDTDPDLLLGDVGFQYILQFENGQQDYNHCYDSMIECNIFYPPHHPVKIKNMPGIFYLDINNDGIKDMVFTPQDEELQDTFQNLNHIWYYKNNGADNNPDLEFVKDDLLYEDMVHLGGPTAPAFFDYDGDKDQDMFVATQGNYDQTKYKQDRIVLFENVGSKDSTVFKIKDNDYLNLSNHNYSGLTISFGDIDGDADKDMFLGNANGKITLFENIAPTGDTAEFVLKSTNFGGIQVNTYSTPCAVDINKDSLTDIVVGEYWGKLYYYQNVGTLTNPQFYMVTDSFGGRKFNRPVAPAIYDLDNNGKLDMIVGTFFGKLIFYKDIDDNPDTNFTIFENLIFDTLNGELITKSLGRRLIPAIADLDNDSLPDIVVGSNRGGLLLFVTKWGCRDYSVITGSMPLLCLNDSLTLEVESGYESYLWSTGEETQSIIINTPGYYLCKTIKHNCSYSSHIFVDGHTGTVNADFAYEANGPSTFEFKVLNEYINNSHWDFGDGTGSFDLQPSHTYSNSGTYKVCLDIQDICGAFDRTCKYIVILSVNGNMEEEIIRVYPNPVKDILVVEKSEQEKNLRYHIRITDIFGKEVFTKENIIEDKYEISFVDFSIGMYIMQIYSTDKQFVEKIKIYKH